MSGVFIEVTVARNTVHIVRQNFYLILMSESFNFLLRSIVCIENISWSIHLARSISLLFQPVHYWSKSQSIKYRSSYEHFWGTPTHAGCTDTSNKSHCNCVIYELRSQIQLIMVPKYLKHQLVAEEKRASVKGMCWCSVLEKSN